MIINRPNATSYFDIDKIVVDFMAICESKHYITENEKLSEDQQERYHQYIQIMSKIDWPAYLNRDTIFHLQIIEEYENTGKEGVVDLIYSYYDPAFLLSLENQLSCSEVIRAERFPILKEAFLLHHLGYYYGSVSILIPQIYGIISDINRYLRSIDEDYDPDTVEIVRKRYGYEYDNEISKIVTAVIEGEGIDNEREGYGYLANYFRFRIFNDLSPKSAEHNPSRHMICHGRQLNFGTREHSLKTIICIDALATIADMIAEDIKEGRPWLEENK